MKMTTVVEAAALSALLAGAPGPSLACGAAGASTQVGRLLSLDKGAGTFTLLVAESLPPLTITADNELLDRVSSMLYHAYQNGDGEVVVTYECDGDTPRALTLE